MAIGSAPEAGANFKSCKNFTIEDWEAWWKYMRDNWGGQLQSGYASLIHKKENNPYYDMEERKRRQSLKQENND